jgi:hypothetical protein
MNKFVPLLSIAFSLSSTLFGQFGMTDYQRAVIIKKNNDSITCLLELNQVSEKELAPLGEVSIRYKTEDNTELQVMKIADIKSIKTGYSTYYSVPVDKSSDFLFKVAIKGKVLLLEYPRISIEHFGPINGGHDEFGPKVIRYYAIKTNDKTVVIKQKKDLKEFSNIIENCPDAKAIADEKFFKMGNLSLIVNKLNECQ